MTSGAVRRTRRATVQGVGYDASEDARPAGRFQAVRRLVFGVLLAVLSLGVIVTAAFVGLLYAWAHPRRVATEETPASLFMKYEERSFTSSDGVRLTSWYVGGRKGAPLLILCHDRGASKSQLLGLGARLSEAGYPILLFDFRGHGESEGTSSFGVLEKRDLIGAIDWASAMPDGEGRRIGLLGVGMGAYASILAAAERPQVRCLVLDSPYPDAAAQYAADRLPDGALRTLLGGWSELVYDMVYRVRSKDESVVATIPRLADRDLLLLAPKNVEASESVARELYDSVPESKAHDKNFVALAATMTTPLYKDDRTHYDEAVLGFFRSWLPATDTEPATRPPRRG